MLVKVQPASSPCCPALPRHCLNIDQGREETIVHSGVRWVGLTAYAVAIYIGVWYINYSGINRPAHKKLTFRPRLGFEGDGQTLPPSLIHRN